eukprot:NODE_15_length_50561_cov_0.608081.p3 type:complete len:914 gc:universal NODE_15_length_50561_cov_0.608081:26987-29728(+)
MNFFGDVDDLDPEMQTALKSDYAKNLLLGGIVDDEQQSDHNGYMSEDDKWPELPKIKVQMAEDTLDIMLKTKYYAPPDIIETEKEEKEDPHHSLTLDDLKWNIQLDQWDKAITYDKYSKPQPTNHYMLLFPIPNYHLIHNMQHRSSDGCALLLDQNDPYLHVDYSTLTQPKKVVTVNEALSTIKQKFNGFMYQLNSVRQTMQYQLNHTDIAKKLYTAFYPLHYTKFDLRHYHRAPYAAKTHTMLTFQGPRSIHKKKIQLAKEILARDGRIVLLEYSEEYPLMMQNVGMVTLFQNFYRKEEGFQPHKPYGSLINLEENELSPLFGFGDVEKGEIVSLIVNNLFRAPIVQHAPKQTDFLFIHYNYKNQDKYYLREFPDLFVVGQALPADQILPPQSRKHLLMQKNRVKQAAFRLIKKHPKRVLHIDSLRHQLPGYSDTNLKGKLRDFMVPVKNKKNNIWALKPGIVISDDLDELCTPEQVCLHHAMLAGEQRLKDLGFTSIRDDENDHNMELEEKVASWILSRNFINAVQGKNMLQLYGSGDPTGVGLGFSFIKTAAKDVFLRENETMEDRMKELSNRPKNAQKFTIAEQQNIYNTEIMKIFKRQMEDLCNPVDFELAEGESVTQQQPLSFVKEDESVSNVVRQTKTLVITRKVKVDGAEEIRQEIVRDLQVINQYIAIKSKNIPKDAGAADDKSEVSKVRKCRACGSTTHIKTSKLCPMNKNHGEHLEKERNRKRKASQAGSRNPPGNRLSNKVKLNNVLEKIVMQMTSNTECFAFNYPVSDEIAPNYSQEIETPMDFGSMLQKCKDKLYNSADEFLQDNALIRDNCAKYNGPTAVFSQLAAKFVAIVEKKVKSSKRVLELTENMANSINDDANTIEDTNTETRKLDATPDGALSDKSSDSGLEDLEALLNQDI